jgi:hypothetical protein
LVVSGLLLLVVIADSIVVGVGGLGTAIRAVSHGFARRAWGGLLEDMAAGVVESNEHAHGGR